MHSYLIAAIVTSVASLLGQDALAQGTQFTEAQLNRVARVVAVGYGFRPDTPMGWFVQSWARDIFSEPLVVSYVLDRTRSDEEVGSVAIQLTSEGMPFLSDLSLRRRTGILLHMLETTTPRECACLTGHPRYGQNDQIIAMRQALPKLTDTDIKGFFEIIKEALLVRIRQQDATKYRMSQEEADKTIVTIAQAVPPHLREQWVSQLMRVESLTDAAYCDVTKTMYKAILKLSGPSASRALRFEFAQ